MNSPTPILVTGSHRSGTTWVGRVLAAAPHVAYLQEPFHIHDGRRMSAARFDAWFTYVSAENEEPYRAPIADMLDDARRAGGLPLIKDPIAVFSAEWLTSRFQTRNVVMIRHPAAFAGSLKEHRWTHPFAHFLTQPLLMRDHLEPFAADILRFSATEQNIVDQAGLLWNLIHAVIAKYQKAFPDWIYVRHEDLSRNPVQGFANIFDRLELPFSDETIRLIDEHSFRRDPAPAHRYDVRELKRDSLANIDTWRTRLTGEEIARLKRQVWDISKTFYSDQEW